MATKKASRTDHDGAFHRILYSVFPGLQTAPKEREGYRRFFNSLVLHFRPRTVPERTLRLTLTWGLGGMSFVCVCLLMTTGLLLKFHYQPIPEKAYESVFHIQQTLFFGQLIRSTHFWSANVVLVLVFLHFLRIFFTGAFHPPRQFNWVIGLGLFLIVLLSNFTGYLLPWDQLAFWAITICSSMLEYIPWAGAWFKGLILGGPEVGSGTLSNFYAVHTAILPALLILLMPFHFWRVRKAGGLVVPRTWEEDEYTRGESVPAIPNLILREVVMALALLAFILVLAIIFEAPLGSKANPGLSPNPTKAPWYFVGLQEILMHFHPFFAVLIIPLLMLIALVSIPYIRYETSSAGIWFASPKGRRMALVAVIVAVAATSGGILLDDYLIDLAHWVPWVPKSISNGVTPLAVVLAGIAGFYAYMKRRFSATNNEAVQMIFVLLLVAFVILTVTGVWFRGEGMNLTWPWKRATPML